MKMDLLAFYGQLNIKNSLNSIGSIDIVGINIKVSLISYRLRVRKILIYVEKPINFMSGTF